jgi:hypothetical protein
MSEVCNKGGGGGTRVTNRVADNINASALTEIEVESGSAVLTSAISSVMSAIAAIELHENELIPVHIEAALDDVRTAQWHYDVVQKIDPERGSTVAEKEALKSLDLSGSLSRWIKAQLIPDIQLIVEELEIAAKSGNPSELLKVFTRRLDDAEKVLIKVHENQSKLHADIQLELWEVTTALVDVLIAGQGVAIVNREAWELEHSVLQS